VDARESTVYSAPLHNSPCPSPNPLMGKVKDAPYKKTHVWYTGCVGAPLVPQRGDTQGNRSVTY
jgi:hypothetical protein